MCRRCLPLLVVQALALTAAADVSLAVSSRPSANFEEMVVAVTVADIATPTNLTARVAEASLTDAETTNQTIRILGSGTYRFTFSLLTKGRSYRPSAQVGEVSTVGNVLTLSHESDGPWLSAVVSEPTTGCAWDNPPPADHANWWLSAAAPSRITATGNVPMGPSRIETAVEFVTATAAADLSLASVSGELAQSRTALTIVDDGSGTLSWRCWNGTSWLNIGTASTLGAYIVRMERDEKDESIRVRYSVKKTNESAFRVLGDWIVLGGSSAPITGVTFYGEGRVSNMTAHSTDCAVAKVGEKRYDSLTDAMANGAVTLLADARLNLDTLPVGTYAIDANGHALRWTDGSKSAHFSDSTLSVVAESSSDGIPSYERQALAITDAQDVIVERVSSDKPDTIRLNIAGISPSAQANAQFELEEAETANFSASRKTLIPEQSADISLDGAVKYYRIKMRVNE